MAIVVYCADTITTVNRTRDVCTFQKHTSAEHAHFLASVSDSSISPVLMVVAIYS